MENDMDAVRLYRALVMQFKNDTIYSFMKSKHKNL